jgi:hypothetical protein
MVFRAFSTQMVGAFITGAYTPACSLGSLSGFWLGRAIIFCTKCDFLLTIEVSTFSGQVSAIEARDAAIFTKISKIELIL